MADTLLSLIDTLLREPSARAAYAAGGEAFLEAHGWRDLDPEDLTEAMAVARQTLPIELAADIPLETADADAADPFGILDHIAGVEPLAGLEVAELPVGFDDAAEPPAFGAGAGDTPAPMGDGAPAGAAAVDVEAIEQDGHAFTDAAELPELAEMGESPVVPAPDLDTEADRASEEADDWLDPMNP